MLTDLQWEDQHWEENFNLDEGDIAVKWFKGGKTNIAYNCLDRHVKEGRGDQPCFLWEGNDPDQSCTMTYKQTMEAVGRLVSCKCPSYWHAIRTGVTVCVTSASQTSLVITALPQLVQVEAIHVETDRDNRHSLTIAFCHMISTATTTLGVIPLYWCAYKSCTDTALLTTESACCCPCMLKRDASQHWVVVNLVSAVGGCLGICHVVACKVMVCFGGRYTAYQCRVAAHQRCIAAPVEILHCKCLTGSAIAACMITTSHQPCDVLLG